MTPIEAPARRYRIAEVGRLTGFSASALRYYEDAGVLPPPDRTPAGYRTYDDGDVERLRLVARAKELGCTLEEIAGLVQVRDADECGPVKHRLRALVHEKGAQVQRLIAEQSAFAAQLRTTAEALSARPVDGPCDPSCGCAASAAGTDQPIACSLEGDEVADRIGEWRDVLRAAEDRQPIPGGLRLSLGPSAPIATIAALAAAEHACCPFFSFAITVDARGVALEVTAPADGRALLHDVFGATR